MTKRALGFLLVLTTFWVAPRVASAAVTINPASPIACGSALVGATVTSATITATSDAGNVTIKFVPVTGCTGFTFPTTVMLNGASSNGTFTVDFMGNGTRGLKTCNFQIQNDANNAVLGTFNATGTTLGPAAQLAFVGGSSVFASVRELDTAATSSSTLNFTVTNNGDTGTSLQVDSISFNGTNPGDWSVVAGGPSFPQTLAQGASAQWTIRFNPAGTGARAANIVVASNEPSMATRSLGVSGTGLAAAIAMTNIAFGTVTAGGSGSTLNTTISNSTTVNQGPLLIASATITSASTWFTFGNGLGCNGGTSCTFTANTFVPSNRSLPVVCTPPTGSSGTATATVTVTSDTDGGGDNVADVSCTAGRADISLNPAMTVDFMTQAVGSTSSPAKTITVSNGGTQNLTFYFTETAGDTGMFAASGPSGCGFDSANQCTVPPGMSRDISVTFTPSSIGSKSMDLTITSNDHDVADRSLVVQLIGTGTAALASVTTPASLPIAFGNVEVGKTSATAQTLVITNTGNINLTITGASLTAGGSDFSVASGTTGAQTTILGMGGTAMWTFHCAPSTHGARVGNFQVTTSGSPATLNIGLTCTGQQGVLVASPTSYNFMGVRAGDTRMTTFTLSNTGNVPVNNITYVADAKLLGFTLTNVPTSLAAAGQAGSSATVTVTFLPPTANDGCAITNAGDCEFDFTGQWGVTPTATTASFIALGDGLNATFDTSPSPPNALNFGNIRYDATPTMPLLVIDTGGSPLQIRDLTLALGVNTAMGEIRIVNCTHNSVTRPCPNLLQNMTSPGSAPPYNLGVVNDTFIVNVQCDPANRTGVLDATLTVTTDLAMMNTRTVPIQCVSQTAGLTTDPATMVVDFGPVDLDAMPVTVTRTLKLTNTGMQPLTLQNGVAGGANVGRYGFSSLTGSSVMPGNAFEVTVSYTPTMERLPDQPDVATLTFPLSGIAPMTPGGMAPTSVTLNIQGYGADRHIALAAAPVFPDTFKNPGDAAPVLPMTVTNTGYWPLNVTAVMLDNDPIWTIQNPDPVMIPADSSYDFNIVFAPVMAGKAPTGHFVVMNNDNGNPLVSRDMDGNGLSRDVDMGPRTIPLGYTGVNIPLRLSDISPDQLLDVVNYDQTHEFTIANIAVDSIDGAEGSFEIIHVSGDDPAGMTLAAGGAQTFDILFTPTEVGDFQAIATLYLDQDPTSQAQVTLTGRGLYVDARGGGGFGCSTTGNGSSGWLVLVLGALLAGARRRARKAALVGAAVVAGTQAAAAQSTGRNLDLNVFEPTPQTVGTTFQVQHADIGPDGAWAASALLTYANNALVLDTSQNDDAAIKNRTVLQVGGSYVFSGRFEAGATVPVLLQSGDPAGNPNTNMRFGIEPAASALGDASLHFKARLGVAPALGGSLTYGAGATLTLPTATGEQFAGTDLPTFRALFLGSLVHKRLSTLVNVGGILRDKTSFANINQGSGVSWGLGATYRVLDKLWAGGEFFGELIPGGKTSMSGSTGMLNTIEGLAGAQFRPVHTMSLGVALGRGMTTGPGTPALRGILTFTYTPSAPELKPVHPKGPVRPPPDDDLDGVPNSKDECPENQEDKDLFKDDDGCPETDNDSDGFADAQDKCPLDAEDKDRFEDEDGCPDKDNDGDGIVDTKDKCPTAAEDKDKFQDNDGCPEADNDKDGIVDAADKCPIEAEVINGTTDDDGCPDKGNSLVVLSPDRIELLEAVIFKKDKVDLKESTNVLSQVGAHLRAHPEILRVRLGVHVQPSKDAAADQKLSEARAKAVREFLVDFGIDALRLQASGFGGKQPLVPPTTKGAQSINDRLEMVVLERK